MLISTLNHDKLLLAKDIHLTHLLPFHHQKSYESPNLPHLLLINALPLRSPTKITPSINHSTNPINLAEQIYHNILLQTNYLFILTIISHIHLIFKILIIFSINLVIYIDIHFHYNNKLY
jgi:hypothetical protein